VRLTIALLALGVATAAGAQTPAPVPRLAMLPDAHCDSTRRDSLADSTITSLDSVDVRPTMRSMDVVVVPDSLRYTYQGTVLELVIDRTGRVDPCRVRVVAETSSVWTAAVLKALKKARFSPAQRHGVAVAVRAIQQVPYHEARRP